MSFSLNKLINRFNLQNVVTQFGHALFIAEKNWDSYFIVLDKNDSRLIK